MSRGGWRKRANDGDGWGGMGGYMAAKVSKLDEQFRLDAPREKQKEGTCSNIFSGVAIYVNGYTDPTADELRRLMMLHGGQFHVYYSRSKTTHIIATNLPNNKIQELRGEKVVRPDWITDSIKAGRLLSYIQYQLYAKQKGLSFPKARVPQGQGKEPTGTSPFTNHIHQEPAGKSPFTNHIHQEHAGTSPSTNHIHQEHAGKSPFTNHIHQEHAGKSPFTNHIHQEHAGKSPFANHIHQELGHTLNHTVNRELGHTLNHPANRELGHTLNHPANRELSHTLSHLAKGELGHTLNHPVNRELGHARNHHANQEIGHTLNHSANRELVHALSHPVKQELGHTLNHHDNQLLGHTFSHPASQELVHMHNNPASRELGYTHYRHVTQELAYMHRHHSTRELSHAHHHCTNRENSHTHLAGQDGDCRPNGSMRPWPDLLAVPKMNGVRAEGSESPDLSPVSAPWGSTEKPLTNGHAHPVNGALKPLDLALHSGRPPLRTPSPLRRDPQLGPPHRPVMQPPSPQTSRSPQTTRSPQPEASVQRTSRTTSPTHKPVLQLPANQNADTVTKPHTPPPQSPGREKPLTPQPEGHQSPGTLKSVHKPSLQLPPNQKVAAATKPQTPPPLSRSPEKPSPQKGFSPAHSKVRLNGTHHFVPPQSPALLPPPPTRAPGTSGPGPLPAKPLARPAESNIISEFYSYSRLHHISTWRSEFSQYVSSLQQQRRAAGGAVFLGRERLRRHCVARGTGPVAPAGPQTQQPCIMHVDMDCFFVSVGIRHRPELKGKPVAVTSNRGLGHVAQRPGANPQMELQYYQRKWAQNRPDERDADLEATPSPDNPENHGNGVDQDVASLSMAEIASCSYEARQAGVRNGMFFGQAKQLCPALQSVPYDFQAYKEVAQAMYETLASYTHDIEALSCDEALLDASSVLAELAVSPDELAGAIRADVRERTGCSASVGMGSNILLARMATRKAKPDGQYYLKSEEVDDFIRDQSVTSLPGVGRSMGCKLASLGVRTCGDLQQIPMSRLQKEFGPRTGQTLYRFCRGLDDRPVRSEKERKSVSAEMNYGIRFTQVEEAESFLGNLSLELQRRLQGAGLRGRRLTLKVMVRKPGAPTEPAKYGGHGICDNLARAVNLDHPTDCAKAISTAAVKLFHSMKLSVTDLRGVGMQMQQLVGASGPSSESPHATGHRPRSVIDMLLAQRTPGHPAAQADPPSIPSLDGRSNQNRMSPTRAPPTPKSTPTHATTPPPSASPAPEPVPGTSKGEPPPRYNGGLHTPSHARTRLNLSIEVPSPSQVDRSVLEALPAELREQVEQSWRQKEVPLPSPPPPLPPPAPPAPLEPVGTLVLHISDQGGQSGPTGIILELPDFSQVDPEVFAALPVELQEELRSAYRGNENTPSHGPTAARNPLLQLKQPTVGRTKRRYKRKNTSPAKKGASPLKARLHGNSPAKSSPAKLFPHVLKHEDGNALKVENGPTVSPTKPDIQHQLSKLAPRPGPTLAGACELSDIRTLLKEWVTTMSDPMEEDILQVVKYCTELVEDRDLEKLDLVIKYMKRLMQQSVESVWSMAFDFILDNVQVVVQQTYGSTLKIT